MLNSGPFFAVLQSSAKILHHASMQRSTESIDIFGTGHFRFGLFVSFSALLSMGSMFGTCGVSAGGHGDEGGGNEHRQ